MTLVYPLRWPMGYPRTFAHRRQSDALFQVTLDRCLHHLHRETTRLDAGNIVVSSNLDPEDWSEDEARRWLDDPGVAIYFTLKGKQMAMGQDRYRSVYGNLRSITLAIEGLRQLERHGGGHMMERAFEGFVALTGPEVFDWRRELATDGITIKTLDEAERAFRVLAKRRHPDVPGGSEEAMARLNRAIDMAREELRR